MALPLASLVIPVKNVERTIRACIESAIKQTYSPLEIIVVYGDSGDGTLSILNEYPIRIVRESYGTVGGARQVGLENSSGEYVCFTDGDCVLDPDWVSSLVKELKGDIIAVGGGTINVYSTNTEKCISYVLNSYLGSANSTQDRFFKERRMVKALNGCSICARRDDLFRAGGFDRSLSLNEDVDISGRLGKCGKVLYTPEAIVYHDQGRDLIAFLKRAYLFGWGRVHNNFYSVHVVPSLVLAILVFLSILVDLRILYASLLLYVLTLIANSAYISIKNKDIPSSVFLIFIYAFEHISYSLGVYRGFIDKIPRAR